MKTSRQLVTTLTVISLSLGCFSRQVAAQSATPVNGQVSRVAAGNNPSTAPVSTVKLSYGLDEIVKLSQAQVDDSVILAFVQNSGKAYQPSAQDVVQLRQAGVSSPVITALIQHGGEIRQAAAEAQKEVQAAAEAAVVAQKAAAAQPTAIATAPKVAPVSTVTYIGYPRTYYSPVYSYGAYYPPPIYHYPAYYPRYSFDYCSTPRVSFGLSFGGGFHRGFYGGFRHCR